jgi:hypothetical protein
MTLTHDEMAQMLATLERLCKEAQELQERIRRAMADRARGDLPDHGKQADRP